MATATTTEKQRQDLRKRTTAFARNTRAFVNKTPRTLATMTDYRQLAKSSGFLGKHYIEACNAGNTDGYLKNIVTCRDEARFAGHWLDLLDLDLEERSEKMRSALREESEELEKIFGAIIHTVIEKKKTGKA